MMPPTKNAAAQFSEAMRLLRLGKHAEAEAACLATLKRNPRHAEALHLAGLLATQLGQPEEGATRLRRALTMKPKDADLHGHLALALIKRGQNDQALASLERSLALNPHSVENSMNYGELLLHLERHADAIKVFDGVIARQSGHAAAHHQRGRALTEAGLWDEALAAHAKALSLDPNAPDYPLGVATALCRLGRSTEALPFAEQALRLKPDFDLALLSRAEILLELGQRDESAITVDAVMEMKPQSPRARRWLGKVLMALGRPERALMVASDDCDATSNDPVPHINRGTILTALNRLEEARLSFDWALALNSAHVEARYNRAFTLLALGHLEDGWRDYEYRLLRPQGRLRRRFPEPAWQGKEPLKGGRLFTYCEQGFGDTIQFARYAIMAADAGADVVLAVQGTLLGLFQDFHAGVTVIGEQAPAPAYDHHCPLLSLPLAFGTGLGSIPAWREGYLKPPSEKLASWAQRVPQGRRRIGLVWSGNANHSNDANRSMPLKHLMPLFQSDDVWVSLQKDVRDRDKPALDAAGILDLTSEIGDYADTAALISALDLVITVDTSVAHLAGALGKTVWLMLPFAPDFRWFLDREDSPWYPSMRLFRQERLGDWDGVVRRIRAAL
ncbi:MAG: tetratricopeptide repeat protein [Roseomonas sp.]|nr:tetratricopeptide repeat protein [Roseomonas sp.]